MEKAYARHLAQRVLADVDFLRTHGHLADGQASTIQRQLEALALADAPESTSQLGAAAKSSSTDAPPTSDPPPPTSHRPAAAAAERQQQERAKVVWAYTPAEADELSLAVGQTVVVLERSSEEWWKGYVLGSHPPTPRFFPATYVEVLPSPPPRSLPPPAAVQDPTAMSAVPSGIDDEKRTAKPALLPPPAPSTTTPAAAPNKWRPGTNRWTSGSPSTPPPPPPPGGSAADGTSVTAEGKVPPTGMDEEQRLKREKLKKVGGRVGMAAASGAGAGAAFGLVSNLF